MKQKENYTRYLITRGNMFFKIAVALSLFFIFSNYSLASTKGTPEITDIQITDYAVTIKAGAPLIYNISKTADPFTLTLELGGVRLGKFTHKIFSQSLGVTEIRPSQITAPTLIARLEILLSTPSEVIPEMKDGSLVLKIKDQEFSVKENLAPLQSAKRVIDVKFAQIPDSVELVIKGDGNMPEAVVTETANTLTIGIPNVKMTASMPVQIPPPIKSITHKAENDILQFKIDMEGNSDATVFSLDDEIVVDIPYKAPIPPKTAIAKKEVKKEAAPQPQTAPVTQPVQPQPNKEQLITLDFQDADITAILRLLADVSGYNIIVHHEVKGKTSMKLSNVHWEQALDVVVKTHGLWTVRDGNIIKVMPYSVFIASNESLAKVYKTIKEAEPQQTKVLTANYVNVEKFEKAIKDAKLLTKDMGSVSVDTRTRTITVKDTASVIEEVEKYLASIDKPTKQILIESRIVELNTNLARSLGIEWGLKARPFNWESAVVGSAASPLVGGMGAPGLINLPASTSKTTDPTSAITVGYLNRKQTFGLDMRLSAIENTGRGKIISKPRIITGDNQKAKIVQGESIPYGERTTTGGTSEITTKFKDVAITIEVTPQITDDNNILLDVLVNKEDLVEFVNIGGGTLAPRTTKLEGKTNVMIENGETMVIGGMYKKDERETEERVPGVASIPLVGELFKKRAKESDVKEYLIFITPKIFQR